MCKTTRKGEIFYNCGSYKRYGPTICSPHTIAQPVLEAAVLEEVNALLAGCAELDRLAKEVLREQTRRRDVTVVQKNLRHGIAERERRKKRCYEDYCDGILSREEFLTYKREYEGEISGLQSQLEQLTAVPEQKKTSDWIAARLEGKRNNRRWTGERSRRFYPKWWCTRNGGWKFAMPLQRSDRSHPLGKHAARRAEKGCTAGWFCL